MSKNKPQAKKESSEKKDSLFFSFNLIPVKYQTPALLAAVLILIIIFFKAGLFDGKVFSSADNIASKSFETFVNDAKAKGEFRSGPRIYFAVCQALPR